mgnify:CR=1 FL=1
MSLSKIKVDHNRNGQFEKGAAQNNFTRISDVNPIIDQVNAISNGTAITTAGSLTVGTTSTLTGVVTMSDVVATSKALVQKHTTFTASTDTTAGWTLTNVKSGLVAGVIKTTSAAAVTLTLDSIANIITAFGTAGVTITTGTNLQFWVDNSQGANTVTVAVDAGTTIAVATPVITGGATLTVSTANKIGLFNLYLTSATTGILSRII